MKLVFFAALAPTFVAALQAPYLSQLGGAQAVAQNGATFAPAPAAFHTETYNNYAGAAAAAAVAPAGGTVAQPPAGASPELLELWSHQVSVELSASQLYLSASIWFRARDLDGMAAWMLDESGEERGHGLAILEFAMKKNFPVVLQPLDAPRRDWETPVQVWEDIMQAEQTNTQNLLKLAAVAEQCRDYTAVAFLNPFHIEQLDAEDKVGGILSALREAPGLLRELDHKLGMEAEDEDHH